MNKVALVTGGTGGIGQATAHCFLNQGISVVILDIDEEKGKAACEELSGSGGDVTFVRCDVSNEEEVKNACQKAAETYGQIDILVNNAGIGNNETTLTEMSLFEWQKVIDVNLTGVFLGMKHSIPFMRKNGGAIVNVSSLLGFKGKKFVAPYNASKAGVITLTKNAALEYGRDRIRVNAVAPGVIDTSIVDGWRTHEEKWKIISTANALKRVGEAQEVAHAIEFLASDKASYITGTTLMVDGGGLTY
ncbi:short chain dehydrogenase [Alkalihalophilus pseudofirmus OF4]|uniref:Short chain dehydrogenase n=1 Tax=Alkalihalophilus pseudofirmus (strain ATCC BAA-2126 / JCM 17055 / OF4) TaxID=398511 RepID=D3FY01_ALKPO|nr:SDR family NAD(P)-dependent oxidoreductase [Alkalihalophilus pseudofirmus]ADC50760.1 short chain dehydrogenase [Alkalihalophilus pseudofirmus OF4]